MSGLLDWYRDLMYNKNDPRTSDWFLISGPGPIITIVVSYVYFSVSAGPNYMKEKKPYSLRKTLFVYNLIQVLLSVYLVYEGLMAGWLYDYSYTCQPVDYSDSPSAMRMARAVYLYFLTKLIELLDTVFFVLRKKQRQISFLHLYHHSMMPICGWIGVRFVAGGHPTLLGLINAFIHIIMYTYYMLASLGPDIQKYLWWKKYLTTLQIFQFVIILVHNLQILFNNCNFSKTLSSLLIVNAAAFIYMFGTFYVKSYKKNIEKTLKISSNVDNNSNDADFTGKILKND